MPFDATLVTANSSGAFSLELYFLASVVLLLLLIAMILICVVCHWFQYKRRNKALDIWVAGTTSGDRYHVDPGC